MRIVGYNRATCKRTGWIYREHINKRSYEYMKDDRLAKLVLLIDSVWNVLVEVRSREVR